MDANNNHHLEGLGDDFLEHILANPTTFVSGNETGVGRGGGSVGLGSNSMGLQLGTGLGHGNGYGGMGIDMPLGLNLEHGGFFRPVIDGLGSDSLSSSSTAQFNERDLSSLYPPYAQPHAVQHSVSSRPQHPQAGIASPNPPAVRPRTRARRGQATDPHSIAERLRRERITDRVRALQELVPGVSKTDRATMVDEIVDYVKFLRLQVKVLSMSRLSGTGSMGQLVSDVPLASAEGRSSESAWEKWSEDGTEQQVAELMEKDIGEALQFLQSKSLCIMPISLASSIFQSTSSSITLKSESNAPS